MVYSFLWDLFQQVLVPSLLPPIDIPSAISPIQATSVRCLQRNVLDPLSQPISSTIEMTSSFDRAFFQRFYNRKQRHPACKQQKKPKKSAKPGLSLHNRSSLQHVEVLHLLQDCFKSGPTWRVHQLRAERGVFGGSDAAE
jgi:hypothetical protein